MIPRRQHPSSQSNIGGFRFVEIHDIHMALDLKLKSARSSAATESNTAFSIHREPEPEPVAEVEKK